MAEADSTSSESGIDNNENKDMPPPFLPSRPAEKPKLPIRETKDKPKSKEKGEVSASLDKKEAPELPYKVPSWSGIPDDLYSLEVLKNGCIISTVDITSKPFHVVGRLPNCDVCLEHPSVSRYHAVIQYKASETSKSEKGFYLYDLDSTHGTFVNKSPLDPRRYYRLRVGYVLKFGGSSRLFILQGPEEPDDSELPQPTEVAVSSSSEVGRVMSEEEYEEWKREREGGRHEEEDRGIDWGMGEDAEEEPAYPADFGQMHDDAEEHQFKDPKKTLRGFFEREGLELEYDVEEKGPGHARVYHCKVKLPIDGPSGEPLYAEAAIAGKKREAVLECAREACRMLDAAGLLRQSTHESKKHKEKNWEENDYYDSDEDTFLDRTGSVEKKRLLRMKRSGKDQYSAETFESLMSKLDALDDEIKRNEKKLQENSKYHKHADTGADSLDDYMSSLGTTLDKAAISQIRRKLFELKKERQRLNKLVQIARPASLPSLSKPDKAEVLNSNDGVLRNTRSQGASSDIAITSTVDPETILRHKLATSPEKNNSFKFSVENPTSSQEADHHNVNHVEQTSAEVTDPNDMKHNQRKHSRVKADTSSKTQDNQETGTSEQFISGKVQTDNGLQEMAIESDSLTADNQQSQDDKHVDKDSGIPKKRKKHSYGVPTQWETVNDPSYSAWMPPAGQTGDGRTHLNDKFGY